MALAVTALVVPSHAAAEPSAAEEAAVLEPITTSPAQALAFWTQARREQAEPLPIVTLPEPAPEAPAEPAEVATSEADAALEPAVDSGARTAALGGTEVTATESTVFPNSANGKVYVTFGEAPFECSGSLITGNVVVTAGHCVIDPETGIGARLVKFEPAYHEGHSGFLPTFGVVSEFSVTKSWRQTAKPGSVANEGNDVAFLKLVTDVESDIEGSLKVAFDQPCNQIYTQYGYPGEAPYNGEILYSHVAPYVGPDTNPNFSPEPMKIASDFTRGASGGPWVVGSSSSSTVLSVTAYGYANQPGYLYGPYFGEAARRAYELVSGQKVPVGIEESCRPLEAPGSQSPPTPSPSPPPSESAPAPPPVTLRVTRVRRRANGSAVLTAKVSAAGRLKLSGSAVRAESLTAPAAGRYKMVVAPKAATNRRLRRVGRAKVGIKVAFRASGRTKRVKRKIQLSRHPVAQSADRQDSSAA
ncbi:MAG TPA: trypsin-like serine protease [Solirubrobacterales bacterium]|nr:trypsin-like serine protease [Solirubrobacterales bacterium]